MLGVNETCGIHSCGGVIAGGFEGSGVAGINEVRQWKPT
jgi:hypothetical protein